MSKPVLKIKGLHSQIEGQEILRGVNLTVKGGEIHVIMGPNGTGKSTLASCLMGHPKFEITDGEVELNGEDVLEMEVDERARKGVFLAMQYPAEVSGVTNANFLRAAMNAKREKPIGLFPFRKQLDQAVEELEMNDTLPDRYLNEGFSGGEKKRNEILQMKMLEPSIVILDEIDSGLDIDALRIVGENITKMADERGDELGILMITHYQRLLNYVEPDFVHVLMHGEIVRSGGPELAKRLEEEGYEWLRSELGIEAEQGDIDHPEEDPLADELEQLFT